MNNGCNANSYAIISCLVAKSCLCFLGLENSPDLAWFPLPVAQVSAQMAPPQEASPTHPSFLLYFSHSRITIKGIVSFPMGL